MTSAEMLSLLSLALFSLADLRYRTAPGVAFYFLAAATLGAPGDLLRVGLVVLAVAWGTFRGWPALLLLPLFLHPSTWAVLLACAGVRKKIIGRADLLALGGLASVFDWPASVAALVGVELWRRWWQIRLSGPLPALPGMFLGLGGYLFCEALFQV